MFLRLDVGDPRSVRKNERPVRVRSIEEFTSAKAWRGVDFPLETPWRDRGFEPPSVSWPGVWFMSALVALYMARRSRGLGFRVKEKGARRAGR